MARAAELPLIAAGDFNSTLPGFPHADVTKAGQNAMAVLQESGQFHLQPTESTDQGDMTYSSSEPVQVIDWILIPPSWEFESYTVLQSELSDHLPVSATVKLGPAQ